MANEITMSAPRERADLGALKATEARRQRAEMVISSAHTSGLRPGFFFLALSARVKLVPFPVFRGWGS